MLPIKKNRVLVASDSVRQDGIYKIVRTEGPASLWRGLSPALVMSVPSNVIYFVGYDYLREYIRPFMKEKDNYAPLVAGGFARTVAVTIVSPIELFRTRLQAATGVQDFQCGFHI